MRKKELFIIFGFTLGIICFLILMTRIVEMQTIHPDLERHAGARETLEMYYNDFISHDHFTPKMVDQFVNQNAGSIAGFRKDLGEPQEYKIYRIKDVDEDGKEAKVRVKYVGILGENTYIETILLRFNVHEGRWLIYNYNTKNPGTSPPKI